VTRFTVSVLPEAEADIREAFLWYRERSLLAADGLDPRFSKRSMISPRLAASGPATRMAFTVAS